MVQFLRDKFIYVPILITIILWLIAFGLVYVELLSFQNDIILHLNLQRHIDTIGSSGDIIMMMIGFLLIAVVNVCLSALLYDKERILSYFVIYSSVWIMVLGTLLVYALTVFN